MENEFEFQISDAPLCLSSPAQKVGFPMDHRFRRENCAFTTRVDRELATYVKKLKRYYLAIFPKYFSKLKGFGEPYFNLNSDHMMKLAIILLVKLSRYLPKLRYYYSRFDSKKYEDVPDINDPIKLLEIVIKTFCDQHILEGQHNLHKTPRIKSELDQRVENLIKKDDVNVDK